eukprot:9056863-Karenia_brevis.AAC.1
MSAIILTAGSLPRVAIGGHRGTPLVGLVPLALSCHGPARTIHDVLYGPDCGIAPTYYHSGGSKYPTCWISPTYCWVGL